MPKLQLMDKCDVYRLYSFTNSGQNISLSYSMEVFPHAGRKRKKET